MCPSSDKLGHCQFAFHSTPRRRPCVTRTPHCRAQRGALLDGFTSPDELLRASAAFLIADLKRALALLETASLCGIERLSLAYSNAESAYRSVLGCRSRLRLNAAESAVLDELLLRIKWTLDATVAD